VVRADRFLKFSHLQVWRMPPFHCLRAKDRIGPSPQCLVPIFVPVPDAGDVTVQCFERERREPNVGCRNV